MTFIPDTRKLSDPTRHQNEVDVKNHAYTAGLRNAKEARRAAIMAAIGAASVGADFRPQPVRIRMHHGEVVSIGAQNAVIALERGDAVALVLADGSEKTF